MSATDVLKAALAVKNLRYVGTRGNTSAPMVIVGEAPGADEDQAGVPFVGASGKELDRMCHDAGIDVNQDVWFTNPYKTRPPDNDLDRLSELGIPDNLFQDEFLEELHDRKPAIIIAAGATPLRILCPQTLSKRDRETRIGLWRGSLIRSEKLDWEHYVIPMYHPAFILREWSERQIAVFCLARAKEELDSYKRRGGSVEPLPERSLLVEQSYEAVVEYLNDCLALPVEHFLSNDIEMLRRKIPYTLAIARSPTLAMSIGLWDYDAEQSVKVWRLLDAILRRRTIGQNYIPFDCVWLEWLGFSPSVDCVSDTLARHHVLHPEFEHKLQFQTFQYTREPYYKEEGRSWKPKDGKRPLQIYNCKDVCVTYEIHNAQDEELNDRPHLRSFLDYEMKLMQKMHWVEKRGVHMDEVELEKLRQYIDTQLSEACSTIGKELNRPTASNKYDADALGETSFNLNSPTQVISVLKSRGLKVPKSRQTGKESSGEEHLNKMFAETNDQVLKEILRVRELNKILGTYVNVRLENSTLYCSYVVTGTDTGRRSSRTNTFGFGTNHQNQPHHSDLGKKFRVCITARSGKVFVECDQSQAEDWVVQAIVADVSGIQRGLDELKAGVDKHKKLAAFVFSKPESECEDGTIFRHVGKMTGHGCRYDMQADTMAAQFAKQGFTINVKECSFFIQKFHEYDPTVKQVYHKWVQDELSKKRMLRTPLGRERIFYGLRPYSNNGEIFRKGYAFTPQSTVGDNTGMAVVFIENERPGPLVMETHDALTLEVDDDGNEVCKAADLLRRSFDRPLTFPNGLTINIPVEIKIGYNLQEMTKCADLTNLGLTRMLTTLRKQAKVQGTITSGPPQPSSQQASSATSG